MKHIGSNSFTSTLNLTIATLISASAFVSTSAWAKELAYKDYPVELAEGERVVVQALRGQVRLSSAPAKTLIVKARKFVKDNAPAEEQARFDAANFSVRRENGAVIIEASGPADKATYNEWMKPGAPEMTFELELPAAATEVLVHEGNVTAQGLKQALAINVVSGSVKATGGDGALRVQVQKGEIKIEKHRGRAEVDSYGARLIVQDLEGDLDLTNFAGESNLTALKGSIEVRTNSGGTSIAKSQGAVDFLAGRGAITLAAFEGPVRGVTDQASVVAGIEGDADVHIESNQGPVTVKLPSESAAHLKLQTEEGVLNLPEGVRSPASAAAKSVSTQLTGDGPKGSVQVKSKTGNVRVRI